MPWVDIVETLCAVQSIVCKAATGRAMRTNTTKARLAEGKVVFGAIISRHAPDLVELFGAIGYDFVMIDGEHGPMSLDDVEPRVEKALGGGR